MPKKLIPQMLSALMFVACISLARAQGTPNVPLIKQLNQHAGSGYNDCWGYTASDGREYALLGVRNGTAIIDITNSNSVAEVDFITSATSLWKDIKTYSHYAYVVTEASGGMQIIDLSDLPNSATLVTAYMGFSRMHNIYIDEDNAMLYASPGSAADPCIALSLADPVAPVEVSTFGVHNHDAFARDNIVFLSEGTDGTVGIFDLATPATPAFVQRFSIPSPGYVHNAWLSEDGNFLMTTEETVGKTIKYWDISNLSNVTLRDEVLAPGGIAHNAHIKGNYAYVSHYDSGMRIYDLSNPDDLVEVGYYDTFQDWGAFPFFASGKVLISDMNNGLYVVYFAEASDADPDDPMNAEDFEVFSDASTPTSNELSWSDPFQYVNLDSLTGFTIEIFRDGAFLASVAAGIGTYTDNGLINGQDYEYQLFVKDLNDSLSYGSILVTETAGGFVLDLGDDGLSAIPGKARLHQNYPNPFNPTTTIQYELAAASRVILSVYDLLGQEVNTLVSGTRGPGVHAATWDGTNQNGRKVSSGLYLYRLEVGGLVQTRKLLLAK